MLIVLLFLACLPLLGLESLRWFRQQGNHRVGRKAVKLAASSSVSWAMLGDYLGVLYPRWSWALSLLFLCAGLGYTWHCARHCYEEPADSGRVRRVLLIYAAVFVLTTWLMPTWLWESLRDNVAATGALSRFRGGLH